MNAFFNDLIASVVNFASFLSLFKLSFWNYVFSFAFVTIVAIKFITFRF